MKTILHLMLAMAIVFNAPMQAFAASQADIDTAATNGVQYIEDNQNADGSIAGFGGVSDWATIGVESNVTDADGILSSDEVSLEGFILNETVSNTDPATTIARKILAIEASGNDSSNVNGQNVLALLAATANNDQLGDETLLNDDIFGIMALSNDPTTYSAELTDSFNYLLQNQADDGGFSYTTNDCDWCGSDSNDTAAAIVAIHAAYSAGYKTEETEQATCDAYTYLFTNQNANGGFAYSPGGDSDGSSTAWAIMALNNRSGVYASELALAQNYLSTLQNEDGGFEYGAFGLTNSDTSTTSHALIALSGSDWAQNDRSYTNENPCVSEVNDPVVTPTPTVTVASPVAVTTTNNTHTHPHPVATNTDQPVVNSDPVEDKEDIVESDDPADEDQEVAGIEEDSVNWSLWLLLFLGLIALGWYMIQSRKNQEQ